MNDIGRLGDRQANEVGVAGIPANNLRSGEQIHEGAADGPPSWRRQT